MNGLPFGRALVDGQAQWCRLDGEHVLLLDRPGYEAEARIVGTADLAAAELLAPVEPTKVVAVGLNFRAHAEEVKHVVNAEPILFLKPASAVIGPGAAIIRPARSQRVDYEAELVVVVGRRCRDVSVAAAADYVAGYTCGNDVTARDLQKIDGQWTRAKSFDTFCPLGPWVVPAPPSPQARISARLDGSEVQHGLVGDMLVAPLALLSFVSGIMTLLPGDVIMTGTPPGIGPLGGGQTVTIAIDTVGELSNPVI